MTVSVTSRASFVQETSATTGTGAYSLMGPDTGFQGFVAGNADGDVVRYSATDGTDWEVCEGAITDGSPDTLSRDTVLESSNGGAAVNWGAGPKTISQVFTPEEAEPPALNDLPDVDVATPADGDVLTYDGTDWRAEAPSGGGSGAPANKILIKKIPLSGDANATFSDIPGDYDRLVIEGYLRSNQAAVGDDVYIFFNGDDTTGNYFSQSSAAYNATADHGEANEAKILGIPGSSAGTSRYGSFTIIIENYTGSGIKTALSVFGYARESGEIYVGHRFVSHDSLTAAITSLEIKTNGGDDMYGTLRLYGEKSITIEDSETIRVKKAVPVTLTGGEFDIDLTDYQDGDRLVIEGQITGAATTTYEAVNVWVNGDTTDTNYHRQGLEGYNGSASAPESNTNALLPITAVSGEYANVRIVVENYAAASIRKYLEGSSITSYTASELHSIRSMVRTSITDPVTSITIAPINTAALSGTLHAYIEKEGVLPTTGYTQSIVLDIGDETTALTTGTAKKTFRMPYAFTLTDVRASVTTAPTGDSIEVDINEAGVSILSTVLSIDATEKTSTTAATPAVISDTELADDAEITIDIDQIGSSTAGAGLKVMLIGHRD